MKSRDTSLEPLFALEILCRAFDESFDPAAVAFELDHELASRALALVVPHFAEPPHDQPCRRCALGAAITTLAQVLIEETHASVSWRSPVAEAVVPRKIPTLLRSYVERSLHPAFSYAEISKLLPEKIKENARARVRDRVRDPHYQARFYTPVPSTRTVEFVEPAPLAP